MWQRFWELWVSLAGSIKALLIAFFSTALSLLLAEAALRILRPGAILYKAPHLSQIFHQMAEPPTWGQPDDELGWVNRAGNGFVSSEPGHNRMGFWPGYRRISGPNLLIDPSKKRIWLFGDSWSQGVGVADEDTFAWRINAKNPTIFLENFGTAGYSTYQSSILFARVLKEQQADPKIVLLGFNPFMAKRDVAFWSEDVNLADQEQGIHRRPPFTMIGEDGRLFSSPGWLTEPWSGEGSSALIATAHSAVITFWQKWYVKEIRTKSDGNSTPAVVSLQILKSMKVLAESVGAKFIVVFLTAGDAPEWQRFKAALQEENVDSFDCSLPLAEYKSYLNGGDERMHPGPKGTEYFARCIDAWLVGGR
jgi:hypothetical protein